LIAAMTDAPRLNPTKRIEQAARDERLARALRENLRRRKEQKRARAPDSAEPTQAVPVRQGTDKDPA
jgi:hypothetical protein